MQVLRILITILDNSRDTKTLAVACHDIAQFIQVHPAGRGIILDLKAKERVMKHMSHPNPEVSKQALLCVQKILLSAKYASYMQWVTCESNFDFYLRLPDYIAKALSEMRADWQSHCIESDDVWSQGIFKASHMISNNVSSFFQAPLLQPCKPLTLYLTSVCLSQIQNLWKSWKYVWISWLSFTFCIMLFCSIRNYISILPWWRPHLVITLAIEMIRVQEISVDEFKPVWFLQKSVNQNYWVNFDPM